VTPDPAANWRELPLSPHAPVSITTIGAAFHLIPTVHSITPNSPAARAGIAKRDSVTKVEFVLRDDVPHKAKYREADLNIDIGEDNWAFASWLLQEYPVAKVRLTVESSNSTLKSPVELVPVEATDWYAPSDRGLDFFPQRIVLKGETIGESMSMGWRNTVNAVFDIYLTLRGLATGDVSVKELHGPIGIADFAYQSAKSGLPDFILFLGIISVNLAVINFLPIPVLDGGHMVFLIWEAAIRRKPSEKIVIAATYCGFAVVVTLMILVFWLDLFVHRN
jgi:regulator of sigma E protease